MLDELSLDGTKSDVFSRLCTKMPVQLQVNFIRLILKDMQLGIPDFQILKTLNSKAVDYYNRNPNLHSLWEHLAQGDDLQLTSRIELFKFVSPMLANRIPFSKLEDRLKLDLESWIIEAKLDGERIQLHTDLETFTYYSRSGSDYSHLFGHNREHGPLSSIVASAFKNHVQDAILDGEALYYDQDSRKLICYGARGRTQPSSPNVHPICMHRHRHAKFLDIVFDIFYLNGEDLSRKTFSERCHILESTFFEVPEYFQLVPAWVLATDISDCLTKSLDAGYLLYLHLHVF